MKKLINILVIVFLVCICTFVCPKESNAQIFNMGGSIHYNLLLNPYAMLDFGVDILYFSVNFGIGGGIIQTDIGIVPGLYIKILEFMLKINVKKSAALSCGINVTYWNSLFVEEFHLGFYVGTPVTLSWWTNYKSEIYIEAIPLLTYSGNLSMDELQWGVRLEIGVGYRYYF